jgi:hypothetical protein
MRRLSAVFGLLLALTTASIALAATFPSIGTFGDDDGNTFEANIEAIAAEGITKGCNPPTNDQFCPDAPVTRGAMAAFMVRAMGYSDDGGGNLFTDDDSSIFESDIDKLGTAGVTKGCNPPTNDMFCPNQPVTRGAMAAFLSRALNLPPIEPVPPNPGDTVNCSDFATHAEAQEWHDFYFPYYGDIANLDGDANGIACESLP